MGPPVLPRSASQGPVDIPGIGIGMNGMNGLVRQGSVGDLRGVGVGMGASVGNLSINTTNIGLGGVGGGVDIWRVDIAVAGVSRIEVIEALR